MAARPRDSMPRFGFTHSGIYGINIQIRKLSDRVSGLEHWFAWFKGVWAVSAGSLCLFRAYGR